MISEKHMAARHKNRLRKLSSRASKVSHYARITAKESGEDFYYVVATRMSMLCLKHLIREIDKMVEVDQEDDLVREAALQELTQRKLFGKKITPWNVKELYKLKKYRKYRHIW